MRHITRLLILTSLSLSVIIAHAGKHGFAEAGKYCNESLYCGHSSSSSTGSSKKQAAVKQQALNEAAKKCTNSGNLLAAKILRNQAEICEDSKTVQARDPSCDQYYEALFSSTPTSNAWC